MKTYETTATVAADGSVKVKAPPELINQEVDVILRTKRPSAAERVAAWERLCRRIQSLPHIQQVTEEDIQREIDAVRAGQ